MSIEFTSPTIEDMLAAYNFGFVIKVALFMKGLTQGELARRANLSSGFISKIINEKSVPTNPAILKRIASVLDLPYDMLRSNALKTKEGDKTFIERYPNLWYIISTIPLLMTYEHRTNTLDRIENRLREFTYDRTRLVQAIIQLIAGNITVDDVYYQGERPIRHYYDDWNQEIDEWYQRDKRDFARVVAEISKIDKDYARELMEKRGQPDFD